MSISHTVYVGPFLRCKFGPASVDVQQRGCPTHGPHGTAFCMLCGTPSQKIIERQPTEPDYGDAVGIDFFAEMHGMEGNDDNEHWLVPNRKMKSIRRRATFDPRGFSGIGFSSGGPDGATVTADEIDAFESEYRMQIKKLRPLYTSIEVEWGVIFEAS